MGGRYGEERKVSLPAIVITAALHVALLAAVLHVRYEGNQPERQRLAVVDLTQPPPAPLPPGPLPPAAAPPTAKPVFVVPTPLISIVRPASPPIVTTPDPTPRPVQPVVTIAQTAPPAPLAPPVATPAAAQAAAPAVVQASDLGARMVSGSPPRYPVESRRQREQGTVVLSLTLDAGGNVAAIAIARSSGSSRLDDAALRAVRKWRWAPTVRNGEALMVRGQVEIPFVLQG